VLKIKDGQLQSPYAVPSKPAWGDSSLKAISFTALLPAAKPADARFCWNGLCGGFGRCRAGSTRVEA
jgi:hypothetical protein